MMYLIRREFNGHVRQRARLLSQVKPILYIGLKLKKCNFFSFSKIDEVEYLHTQIQHAWLALPAHFYGFGRV